MHGVCVSVCVCCFLLNFRPCLRIGFGLAHAPARGTGILSFHCVTCFLRSAPRNGIAQMCAAKGLYANYLEYLSTLGVASFPQSDDGGEDE